MAENILAPSILASDFLDLRSDLEFIEKSEAQWLHIDIMDGLFVPNISFGPDIVHSMKKVAVTKVFDVHLMIEQPERYFQAFKDSGADRITVHLEACPHLHRSIQLIHNLGLEAGVALNPHSPIELITHVLEDLDQVLLMSVNPGFGGQKFIYRTLSKIKSLREQVISRNAKCRIVIDGGVGLQNAEMILAAGADTLVAGSSILKSENRSLSMQRMLDLCSKEKWV